MQEGGVNEETTVSALDLMDGIINSTLSVLTMSSEPLQPINDGIDEDDAPSSAAAEDDVVLRANYGTITSIAFANESDGEEEESLVSNTSRNWMQILYLSLFTTVGVTLRAFAGRFFGGDCESNAQGRLIDDFLWPLSHKICITASGKTQQYGGALFLDLPANMFGSFIMGLMTGFSVDWPVLPCLSHDHPLQKMSGLHFGIKTALCGSFTTFSSWNSQMVLMMNGTANPFLGSQILAAILGYVIGLQAALGSYRAGRTVAAWFHLRKNPHIFDSGLSIKELRPRRHHIYLFWITPLAIASVAAVLVILYILGDVYWGIPYYRQLWIACLVAPIGTISRWKLGTLNGKFSFGGKRWFPAGTFLANLVGSILSASLSAWDYIENGDRGAQRWKVPIIQAVSLGVAGSLSTVSTFAKECTDLLEKNPPFDKKAFLYSFGTILVCCLAGLAVYSPIIRYA